MIDALLAVWAEAPADETSVRALVQRAGAAQSAIHYHFGDMEHLYVSTSEVALAAAQDWMAQQITTLAALAEEPLPAALQASVIATVIADWTQGQRRLAMAWRHAPNAAWQAAWDGFWHRLAALIGLGEAAGTLAAFAAGETARHLLVWNPALDRALLEETVAALIIWLREGRLAPDRVRPVHSALARRCYDAPAVPDSALAARMAATAGLLLAEQGYAGVTFRAVAAAAGVTLGKVIHVFGTKSGLLHAALHSLYQREALGGDQAALLAQSFPPDVMLGHLLDAILGGQQPVLHAYDEIECAIYNGPEYAALRGLIRSMDDPSGTWALQQMLGGLVPPAALVAAFSAIIRGIGRRVTYEGSSKDEFRSYAIMALQPFML
ncbi:MAG: TetR/AcrR family transcriptional regulator [Erythrobacter sp.]|nr:TetR/AcrR family transcriptional regulator [Erythrobacter sp.]